MQNDNSIRTEISLDEMSMLIKKEAPKLIGELEKRYVCYEEQSPTKLLEDFQNLTQNEKFKLLGWIISAMKKMRQELTFFKAMEYVKLSTAMRLESMTDEELKKADLDEKTAFEYGYKKVLKRK